MLLKYLDAPRFLSNGLFRFSQPGALHDPHEALPDMLYGKYSDEDYERVRRDMLWHPLHPPSQPFLEQMLAPFPAHRMDEKTAPGLWPARIPGLRREPFETSEEMDRFIADRAVELCRGFADQNIGIFCLTESRSDVMWDNYTAGHTGLVVNFDSAHPFFHDRVRPVRYSDRPVYVSTNGGLVRIAGEHLRTSDIVEGAVRNVPDELLFRKRVDYQHEAEWRMVLPLSQADEQMPPDARGYPVCLYRVPKQAIFSVTFGFRADPSQVSSARSQIASDPEMKHVQFWVRRRTGRGVVDEKLP